MAGSMARTGTSRREVASSEEVDRPSVGGFAVTGVGNFANECEDVAAGGGICPIEPVAVRLDMQRVAGFTGDAAQDEASSLFPCGRRDLGDDSPGMWPQPVPQLS